MYALGRRSPKGDLVTKKENYKDLETSMGVRQSHPTETSVRLGGIHFLKERKWNKSLKGSR